MSCGNRLIRLLAGAGSRLGRRFAIVMICRREGLHKKQGHHHRHYGNAAEAASLFNHSHSSAATVRTASYNDALLERTEVLYHGGSPRSRNFEQQTRKDSNVLSRRASLVSLINHSLFRILEFPRCAFRSFLSAVVLLSRRVRPFIAIVVDASPSISAHPSAAPVARGLK